MSLINMIDCYPIDCERIYSRKESNLVRVRGRVSTDEESCQNDELAFHLLRINDILCLLIAVTRENQKGN